MITEGLSAAIKYEASHDKQCYGAILSIYQQLISTTNNNTNVTILYKWSEDKSTLIGFNYTSHNGVTGKKIIVSDTPSACFLALSKIIEAHHQDACPQELALKN